MKEIVNALISKGINVNAYDNFSDRPLHMASRNGFAEVAIALLNAGKV